MSNDSAIAIMSPKNLCEAQDLATILSNSRIIPQALQKSPADCMAVVMAGAELGLAPMASLRAIQLINGKLSISADGMHAVALSSPGCEFVRCVETSTQVARFEAKRRGGSLTTLSFTMDDARSAGLTANATYQKYPAQMLRARALAGICRLVFPDVLLGVYEPSELQTIEGEVVQRIPPPQDVLPQPHPTRPDPVETELTLIRVAIAATKATAELTALVPRISRLPESDKSAIRSEYVGRMAALEEAKIAAS